MDLFEIEPQALLGRTPDIDIEVTVVKDLPELEHGRLIFDADQGLWKLFEADGRYYLETSNVTTHEPYIRSWVSPDFSKLQLWVHETKDLLGGEQFGWVPSQILNPVAELCLMTRISRQGGVLLHASAVKIEGVSYVFSGPSGAGKSTISEIFKSSTRSLILSDEKVIIRRHGDQFVAYGTPWYGSSQYAANDQAPLERFFIISHGSQSHQFRKLSFLEWSRRFLHECSFPYWDKQGMEQTAVFLEQLMRHSEGQELSFLKDASVVDFIQASPHPSLSPRGRGDCMETDSFLFPSPFRRTTDGSVLWRTGRGLG